ncbi:MAG TPA: YbaK/EbsC family protein [Anaerolineales bacterium]|nr:YbaK/EbsC family protein [Anaerolineales bacterium]
MTDRAFGPADLQAFMQSRDIPGEILYLDTPTPTVESAALAVGVLPDQIVKSILFLVDGKPVLAIACGPDRVETRALAARYAVGRKRVKLADAETVLELTGFQVGAMPPFGHRVPLPTLVDQRVLERPEVYAGGGSDQSLLRLSPLAILQITRAEVLDLLSTPAQSLQSAAG